MKVWCWVPQVLIPALLGALSVAALAQESGGECHWKAEITQKNAVNFARHVRSGLCRTLRISSPGGDIKAAMALGRSIRKAQMTVITVPPGCKSACVLLYAAGVERAPYGEVAIHRPYYLSSATSIRETGDRYRKLERDVKAYLREMNVSERLYDDMMRIPPEDMKSLTLSELESYGLGFEDPVSAEHAAGLEATRLGMTKLQYLAKLRSTKEECGNVFRPMSEVEFEKSVVCWNRVWPGKLKS
ncbi:MAG: hypothetical protein QG595_183 [Pseudomonadota bacterium]|nr:hypothetical protein [Pseudomonadota bacterium]